METLPPDLKKVLAAKPRARAQWDALTPIGRRDFVSWISAAKLDETRARRVESVPSRLASGKKRPCCYALVPMNFYKELTANPKAKAVWQSLAPDAKRDFTDWIETARNKDERGVRMARACVMLAAGKKRP